MLESRMLWPMLLLLGGSLGIPRLRPWLGQPGRAFLGLLVTVISFGLTLIAAPSLPDQWTFSPGLSGTGLVVGESGFAAPFLLMVSLVMLAVTLGSLDERWESPTDDYVAALLAVGAGLLAVGMAANFVTLLAAFVLLDVALLYAFGMAGRSSWALTSLVLGTLALAAMRAATLVGWPGAGTQELARAVPPLALRLLSVAFLVRLGLFPLQHWAMGTPQLPQRLVALIPAVSVGACGLWLVRGGIFWGTSFLPAWLSLPAAATLLGTGILAGRYEALAGRVAALAVWYGAWVVWAVSYGRPDLGAILVWGGTIGGAALALSERLQRSRPIPSVLSALVGAVLIGAPGSALFTAAPWLFGQALYRREVLVATLGVLGVATMGAALLGALLRTEPEEVQRSRWTGLALLALASWPLLGRWLGAWPTPEPMSAGRWEQPLPWAVRYGPLLLGWCGAWLLWRLRWMEGALGRVMHLLARVVSLEWLWRPIGRLIWILASALRGAVRVVEGENYGWLLLFVFLTLFFLTRGG